MKAGRLFLAAMTALSLAGCYVSDKPLVSDDKAVASYEKITFAENGSSDQTTLVREGKAYVASGEGGTMTMRFLPIKPDWYVVEVTGDSDGELQRLYAVVKVDLAAGTALTYAAVARKGDTGPGLTACKDGVVCVESLETYLAHAQAAIDGGAEPDGAYDFTVE